MKTLITDKLTKQLEKQVKILDDAINVVEFDATAIIIMQSKIDAFNEAIIMLQSLRQQEVQNVIDIHIELVREGIEREGGTKFTKEDEVIIRRDVNGYFTQTFEQKGGEKK